MVLYKLLFKLKIHRLKVDYKLIVAIIALFVTVYLFAVRDFLGITYKRHIRSADTHYNLDEYETAKDYYIKGLEVRPNDPYCLARIRSCKEEIKRESEGNSQENEKEDDNISSEDLYKITSHSIGGISLGMKVADIENLYKKLDRFTYDIIQSCDGPCDIPNAVNIKDKQNNEILITCIFGFLDDPTMIHEIFVWSDEYKTYNGVYPGMLINDYLKIYPNAVLYKYPKIGPTSNIENEYFYPVDLQSNKNVFHCTVIPDPYNLKVITSGKEIPPNGFTYLINDLDDDRSRDFSINGSIGRIIIEMKDFDSTHGSEYKYK